MDNLVGALQSAAQAVEDGASAVAQGIQGAVETVLDAPGRALQEFQNRHEEMDDDIKDEDSGGNSADSEAVPLQKVPPEMPIDEPEIIKNKNDTLVMCWKPAIIPEGAADTKLKYLVEMTELDIQNWLVVRNDLEMTSTVLRDHNQLSDCLYRIRAYNEYGESEPTEPSLYQCNPRMSPAIFMDEPKMTVDEDDGDKFPLMHLNWEPAALPKRAKHTDVRYLIESKQVLEEDWSIVTEDLEVAFTTIEIDKPENDCLYRVRTYNEYGKSDPTRPSTYRGKPRVPPTMPVVEPKLLEFEDKVDYFPFLQISWESAVLPEKAKQTKIRYLIEKDDANNGDWTIVQKDLAKTSFVIEYYQDELDCKYRVQAYNEYGQSQHTRPIIYKGKPHEPPIMPQDEPELKNDERYLSTISVKWRSASLPVGAKRTSIRYLIEQQLPDGSQWSVVINDIEATSTSIYVGGIEFDCQYRVKVYNEYGTSDPTRPVTYRRRPRVSPAYSTAALVAPALANGICKCHRKNYIMNGKEIPEGVGAFLKYDRRLYDTVWKSIEDTKGPILFTDKIDKIVNSGSTAITMTQSPKVWSTTYNDKVIESLQDEFKVIIKLTWCSDIDDGSDLPQFDGPDVAKGASFGYGNSTTKLGFQDTSNGFSVHFCNANLTDFPADAIVNSSTPNLDFNGVLSGKIGEEGGSEVIKECKDYKGPLPYGGVYTSGAGNLNLAKIIHVASPVWRKHGGSYSANQYLVSAAKNVFAEADQHNLRTVALPAISAGGFGFPMEVSLLSIFTGINQYFQTRTSGNFLKRVCLVDINLDVIDEVENAMKEVFDRNKVLDSEQVKQKNGKSVNVTVIGGDQATFDKIIQKLTDKCGGVTDPVKNKYPATWSPMARGEPIRFEKLSHNSVDYMQLEGLITDSIKGAKIKQIERIQHPELYNGMMDHKKLIEKEVGWKDQYEKKLWHGTSAKAAESIKADTFRMSKFQTGIRGRGIYLGEKPSVSHGYTSGNVHYMFRCTAMMGKSYEYDNKLATSSSTEAPKGYHSVTASRAGHNIVFRETQVCPDYLITYTE